MLRTFEKTPTGRRLVSCPMDLAVSNNSSVVYIADKHKGIFAVDRQGVILSEFRSYILEEPGGICTDFNNHVLVCGFMSNNVIELDKTLEDFAVVADRSTIRSLRSPCSVCFLPWNSTFVITSSDFNGILTLRQKP